VPKKYVPHFKAGKELRERVDEALEAAEAAAAAAAAARQQTNVESSPAVNQVIAAVRTGAAKD
jgi:hypothetical protein